MLSTSILTREDGVQFRVTNLAHWSAIASLDGKEVDYVKWYGGDETHEYYVSAQQGHSYKVPLNKREEVTLKL